MWYRRAVACGDDDALVEVGWRCYAGIGTRPDADEAVRCFRRAIASKCITQAGREDAMFHLGVAYNDGRGVRQSPALAVKWLSKANHDGDHIPAKNLIKKINKRRMQNHDCIGTR